MDGNAEQIMKRLRNYHSTFRIPVYQRNYDWGEHQCEQLWKDLMDLVKHPDRPSHFFGSIVAKGENDDWLIIDGQQRITTITLIIIALCRAAKNGDITYRDVREIDELEVNNIFIDYNKDPDHLRLIPIEKDRQALRALASMPEDQFVQESNLTANYRYFYQRIKSGEHSLEDIKDALFRLTIIFIYLSDKDDPQMIFESLNSTGLDLSEADKVRNFLLMSLSTEEQERCYRKYWRVIEYNTGSDPTRFIRDYLSIRTGRIASLSGLYYDFKHYFSSGSNSREEEMREMEYYSRYYRQVIDADTDDKSLNTKLQHLGNIGSEVGSSYYMDLLSDRSKGLISTEEAYQALSLIENWWARRIICDYPANSMTKIFCTLHRDVYRIREKSDERQIPYHEVLKYIVLSKTGKAKFPDDTELKDRLGKRQVYLITKSYRNFLLERLENEDGKESIDIIRGLIEGTISIEHIMPQKLTPDWRKSLGEDYERVHAEYLHTLANITLTGYNSDYGNRSFDEKKNGYVTAKGEQVKGYRDSKFALTQEVCTYDHWDEASIQRRQEWIYDRLIQLWPMPETDFAPREDDVVEIRLSDDERLTYKILTAFSYQGETHECSLWVEMLTKVAELLYAQYPETLRRLCAENKFSYFTDSLEGQKYPLDFRRLGSNVYLKTALSNTSKRFQLQILFDECGIDQEDLVFYVKLPAKSKTTVDRKEDSGSEDKRLPLDLLD